MSRPRSLFSLALALVPFALLSASGCQSILGLDKYSHGPDSLGGEGGEPSSGGKAGTGGTKPGAGGSESGAGGGESEKCDKASQCDDKNECTQDECDGQRCTHDPIPDGEACDGGVCNGVRGAEKCQACIDDQPGTEVDSGCKDGTPQCRTTGTIECLGCSTHENCDDNNDCTSDACRTDGSCKYTAKLLGATCQAGGKGVCDGTTTKDACAVCHDTAPDSGVDTGCSDGSPICTSNGCSACQVVDAATDIGCSEGAPTCDEASGLCKNECSDVVCTTDGCELVPDDSQCPSAGGCPGRCDVAEGCLARATKTASVVCDPSFKLASLTTDDADTKCADEGGKYWWTAAEATDSGRIDYKPTDISNVMIASNSGYDGSGYVARLPKGAGLGLDVAQALVLPESTKKLTVSGYYRSVPDDPAGDPGDYAWAAFYNYDDDQDGDVGFVPEFMTTELGHSYSKPALTTGWENFTYELSDLSLLPVYSLPEINFVGEANSSSPLVVYELGSLDVIATYCE